MDRYIDSYILSETHVELLRSISDLADKLFDFSVNLRADVDNSDSHVYMNTNFRDFVRYTIDAILLDIEDNIEWRKSVIKQEQEEMKENENKEPV